MNHPEFSNIENSGFFMPFNGLRTLRYARKSCRKIFFRNYLLYGTKAFFNKINIVTY
jgi:hypothetical protein